MQLQTPGFNIPHMQSQLGFFTCWHYAAHARCMRHTCCDQQSCSFNVRTVCAAAGAIH